MPEDSSHEDRSGGGGLAAVGIGALAIACCAGVPLIAAVAAGSVAAGTLLGVGAGLVAAVVLAGVIVLRVRARRRAAESTARPAVPAVPRHD